MGPGTDASSSSVASATDAHDLAPYLSRTELAWPRGSPRWRSVDGTLVFADVSGFTPLTERLARLGKAGAEELTEVLNEVFGRTLLPVAARHGGDLLKFGGDALFLLFDGPGHVARAAVAAAEMQEALRPFRRLRTPSGQVALRMSVGVATGPVELFLVGTSHHELLVAGPTVSAAAELESAAEPGQVLLGGSAGAQLDPSSTRPSGSGHLLRRPPDVETSDVPPAVVRRDPCSGIPVGLRGHLGLGRGGEHRTAALTFLQFKGTDALLAREGAAAVADELHRLVAAVQGACEAQDVCFLASDIDRDGGKILLVAGAPTAHEDDADRMLLALRRAVPVATRLKVRAGVNHGRAFAVDVGSRERRTFAVMGDATNLAARVMGKAGPGEVLATTAVLDRVRTAFALRPLEPFRVKGKSTLVHASAVGDPTGRREPDADATVLVGRTREFEVLQGVIREVGRGRGSVLEFVGEAGIGKSLLVSRGLEEVPGGIPVVRVEGALYASSTPYFAFRGPLRALFGLSIESPDGEVAGRLERWLGRHAPDLLPRLPLIGIPFGLDLPENEVTAELDPNFRRAALETAVHRLLERRLTTSAVVVLEDTHWLDGASVDLVRGLLGMSETHPWAILLTRRPGASRIETSGRNRRSVVLGPLDEEGAAALAAEAGASDLSRAELRRAIERSGGNPLFLREILVAARERGIDVLPDTVEPLIAARIDTLEPPARRLLRYASVLGGRVDVELLRDLVQRSDPRALEALPDIEAFLPRERSGHRRFTHALVRDVAYATLPFRSRRELHGTAGELVERRAGADVEGWSDLLSLHFHAAGRPQQAWRYSLVAAERARRNAAPTDAITFYRRAIESGRALPHITSEELAAVHESLGDVCELAGDYERASQAYGSARRLVAGRVADHARLAKKQGWVRERESRYPQALRWYTKGLNALENLAAGRSATLRGELTLAYGAVRLRQGRYADAARLLRQAAEIATQIGDDRTLGHAYYLLDWALTDLGDPDAHTYRSLALPIFERLGDLVAQGNVLNNTGVDAYYEGRWDEAIALYERSRLLRERAGDAVQMGTSANNIGEIRSDQGRLDEAGALFREAMTVWSEAPWPLGVALATSNLGRAAARRGEATAGALLEEAASRFGELGADGLLVEALARQAERYVLVGDPAPALELVADVRERADRAGGLPVVHAMIARIAGYAWLQMGDLATAEAELAASAVVAAATGARYESALTHQAIARAAALGGDGERAASSLAACDDIFRTLGVVRTPDVPLRVPNGSGSHGSHGSGSEEPVGSLY